MLSSLEHLKSHYSRSPDVAGGLFTLKGAFCFVKTESLPKYVKEALPSLAAFTSTSNVWWTTKKPSNSFQHNLRDLRLIILDGAFRLSASNVRKRCSSSRCYSWHAWIISVLVALVTAVVFMKLYAVWFLYVWLQCFTGDRFQLAFSSTLRLLRKSLWLEALSEMVCDRIIIEKPMQRVKLLLSLKRASTKSSVCLLPWCLCFHETEMFVSQAFHFI